MSLEETKQALGHCSDGVYPTCEGCPLFDEGPGACMCKVMESAYVWIEELEKRLRKAKKKEVVD